MNRLFSIAALVLLGIGCLPRNNGTMLLVQVRSDLAVPDHLDQVSLQARLGSGPAQDQTFSVTTPPIDGVLARLALVPKGDPNTRVEVTARGLKGGNLVVSQTVVVSFEAGQAQMIDIWLMSACVDLVCSADKTCVNGECVPRMGVASTRPWTSDGGDARDGEIVGAGGSGGAIGSGGAVGSGGATGPGGEPGSGGVTGSGGAGGALTPASLAVSTTSLPSFGSVVVGESSGEASVTIINNGQQSSGPLTIASGSTDFVIRTGESSDCVSGSALAAGLACSVRVVFVPKVAGPRSAFITFSATPGGNGSLAVSGTGITAAALATSGTSLSFSSVLVGASGNAPQVFTLTNNGQQPSGVITLASNSTDFVIQGTSGDCESGVTTLPPSGSCLVHVVFSPKQAGARSGTVTFSALPGGSGGVQVSGTGLALAALGITPGTLSFAVEVGSASAAQTLTIKNAGDQTSTAITFSAGGTNPGDFTIQPAAAGDCVSGTTTLVGNASCTIRVKFAPTAAGSRNATIGFSATTGGSGNAALTGTGIGWISAGALAAARAGHSATLLKNGKVLIAGGGNSNGTPATSELYDPATGTWSSSPMQFAQGGHAATLLETGKVLLMGTSYYYASSQTCYVSAFTQLYDGGWTTGTPMPGPLVGHTATLLATGKVLVAGGCSSLATDCSCAVLSSSSALYDPATGSWSTISGLSTSARYNHTATRLASGKVLVAGGYSGSSYPLSAELYDPATNTWTPTGSMNGVRSSHTATLLKDGKVLVTGLSAIVELYNPATGAWAATGSMNTTRTSHRATLLGNGKVLVAGGLANGGGAVASAELYDPATGLWSATTAMNGARYGHTATLLGNGMVLVVGGSGVASAELYVPGP